MSGGTERGGERERDIENQTHEDRHKKSKTGGEGEKHREAKKPRDRETKMGK